MLLSDTVGFVAQAARTSWSRRSGRRSRWSRRRPARPRRRRVGARPRWPDRRGARGARRDRRRPRCPSCSCSTRSTSPPTTPSASSSCHPGSVAVSAPDRRGHRRAAAHHRRPAAGAGQRRRAASSRTTAATCWPRCTARARSWSRRHDDDGMRVRARLDRRPHGSARLAEFAVDARDGCTRAGFVPPPYPYDRLDEFAGGRRSATRRARRPVDRHAVRPAARGGASTRWHARTPSAGYPPSIGIAPRSARRRPTGSPGASASTMPPDQRRGVHRHQGVRRRACRSGCACGDPTATPCSTRPCQLSRPTRWARRSPAAGRCRCRSTTTGTSTSTPIDDDDAERALCLWVNAPGNPTGASRRSRRRRPRGAAPTASRCFSDECYAEFTWDGRAAVDPRARHRRRPRRALALEAIEPGRRARRLLRRRRRPRAATSARCASTPGSWCPARCRPPLSRRSATTTTSRSSAPRYRRAPRADAPTLLAIGRASRAHCPAAASTCGSGARRRRVGVRRAARRAAAALVSPGEFYGAAGAEHVRLAVVAARRPHRARRPAPRRATSG